MFTELIPETKEGLLTIIFINSDYMEQKLQIAYILYKDLIPVLVEAIDYWSYCTLKYSNSILTVDYFERENRYSYKIYNISPDLLSKINIDLLRKCIVKFNIEYL